MRQAARKTRDHLNNDQGNEAYKGHIWSLQDFEFGPVIAKGCSAVVYAAKCLSDGFQHLGGQPKQQQNDYYPIAIKMMFNFHAESNAQTILKAMQK